MLRDLISNVGTDYAAFAITGVLALIVTLVYLWWNEQSSNTLTCPGLKSSDEDLGNLGELTRDGGLQLFLLENHKKFGPIFSFYWCKEIVVSLSSPELFKQVQNLFDRPEELSEKLSTMPKDEHIPLRQNMLATAAKAMVRSSFGPDYFKTSKDLKPLTDAYDVCWADMASRLHGDFPESGSERLKKFNTARDTMRSITLEVIELRRALKEKTSHNFLDVLLEDEELYPNDEQLIDMVLTYFIAGLHTTGNLLTFAFYFICKHPDVEKKLLDEFKYVVGDDAMKFEDIEKLKYTRQVLDETLRRSAIGTMAARYSEYDISVGGHIIPKLTPIVLALGVELNDENLYPEPKKFDPDRFSPEQVKQRKPLSFEPFGFAGKRKCPGYRFSYFDSTVILVDILRKFKVKLVDGQNVEMQHCLVTQPKEEIWITVEPRD